MSAVMVHFSQAYKNMDMAREGISLILELMAMFLLFQMTFSLVTAAVVWAIMDSTSGFMVITVVDYTCWSLRSNLLSPPVTTIVVRRKF